MVGDFLDYYGNWKPISIPYSLLGNALFGFFSLSGSFQSILIVENAFPDFLKRHNGFLIVLFLDQIFQAKSTLAARLVQ
jgi:hypothetical protein